MTASARRRLTVAYDGADFSGWQIQPDRPTVQGELQRALERIAQRAVIVRAAGRTDAGVHARGQVVHFDDPTGLPPERLERSLNGLLPPSVRVRGLAPVAADFHATHDATRRTYVYQLHLVRGARGAREAERRMPPDRRRTFHAVPGDLDVGAMRAAAARLLGRHDFTALSRAMGPERTTTRTLFAVRVLHVARGLRVVVSGDGFLYGMVRILTALLVEVGRGRRAPGDCVALIASCERARAPALLPACGLTLLRVDYRRPDAASAGAG